MFLGLLFGICDPLVLATAYFHIAAALKQFLELGDVCLNHLVLFSLFAVVSFRLSKENSVTGLSFVHPPAVVPFLTMFKI